MKAFVPTLQAKHSRHQTRNHHRSASVRNNYAASFEWRQGFLKRRNSIVQLLVGDILVVVMNM